MYPSKTITIRAISVLIAVLMLLTLSPVFLSGSPGDPEAKPLIWKNPERGWRLVFHMLDWHSDPGGPAPKTLTLTYYNPWRELFDDGTRMHEHDQILSVSVFDADGKPVGVVFPESFGTGNGSGVIGFTGSTVNGWVTNTGTQNLWYNGFGSAPTYVADITVTKIWKDADNAHGTRPESILIQVINEGKTVESHVLRAADADSGGSGRWTFTFTLPVVDAATGESIVYAVDEAEIVPGSLYPLYAKSVDQAAMTVTNTLNGITSLGGKKIWDDNEDAAGKRPGSVDVVLLRNEEAAGLQTISGPEWIYVFDGLDKYDESGGMIVYRVEERETNPGDLAGYISSVNEESTLIVNAYTAGDWDDKTSLYGSKHWDDEDNVSGKRPESLVVVLFCNDEPTARQTISGPDWAYGFAGLDKYGADGEPYVYTVEEEEASEGDLKDYDGEVDPAGMRITNTLKKVLPASEGDILVKKILLDQDGLIIDASRSELFAQYPHGFRIWLTDHSDPEHPAEPEECLIHNGETLPFTIKNINNAADPAMVWLEEAGMPDDDFLLVGISSAEWDEEENTFVFTVTNQVKGGGPPPDGGDEGGDEGGGGEQPPGGGNGNGNNGGGGGNDDGGSSSGPGSTTPGAVTPPADIPDAPTPLTSYPGDPPPEELIIEDGETPMGELPRTGAQGVCAAVLVWLGLPGFVAAYTADTKKGKHEFDEGDGR